MGQKVHPIGFRLAVTKDWQSKWYAPRLEYADQLHEDLRIRRFLDRRLQKGAVSKVVIERAPNKVTVTIHTARPGMVIGRKGAEVDQLRDELQHLTHKEIYINIQEVRKPEIDAQLIAEHVGQQLEQRIAFRRAMRKAVVSAMRMGALGIRIQCGGRLGGAEMGRSEQYREGRVPLHTLRAHVEFARHTAHTTFGCVGVKVWVYHGEVFEKPWIPKEQSERGMG